MTEPKNQSQPDDAVLSDSKGDRRLVLGGIEGIKQHLSSDLEAIRIEAVSQASQYGKEGLYLIIKAFREDTEAVRRSAYFCLRDRQTPEIEKIIQGYYPWDWKSCKNLFTCPMDTLLCDDFVVSANGQVCAFERRVRDRWGNYHEIVVEIWDLLNCQKVRTLTGLKSIKALAITADGQTLITHDYIAENLVAWNTQTGEKIFSKTARRMTGIVMVEGNKTFVIDKTSVEIWNLQEQKLVKSISVTDGWEETYDKPYHLRVQSGSGILLRKAHDLPSTNEPIEVWNLAEGKTKKSYTLYFPEYYQVELFAINPNKLSFATAMSSLEPYDPRKPYNSATFRRILQENPNERIVRGRAITLWKLQKDPSLDLVDRSSQAKNEEYKSMIREKQFLGILEHNRDIRYFAFSPDGKRLASSNCSIFPSKNEVKIWNLDSYKEICTVAQEEELIKFVGFNQDSNILYTVTNDCLSAWGF